MPTFYARVKTRSRKAKNKGTSTQAMAYMSDSHDSGRLFNVSDGMIMYIARIDPSHKQDLEGGRVALHGHGVLKELTDRKSMTKEFQFYEEPKNNRGGKGTTGYKEITLTLPKELSLVCLTDKEKAQRAVLEAVDAMLAETYKGIEVASISAMHTKNQAGEPHLNVHVLVAKFGRRTKDGKWGSLNNGALHEDGCPKDEPKIKKHWTENIVLNLEREFGVRIDFGSDGKCNIVTKENVPLEPIAALSIRERQIAWEEANAPVVPRTDGLKGNERRLDISMFDAKILETAAMGHLDKETFAALFPNYAYDKAWAKVEKRIATLQSVGYLNEKLRPTKEFREHAEVKLGQRPEFAQLKADCERFIMQMAGTVPTDMPLPPQTGGEEAIAPADTRQKADDDHHETSSGAVPPAKAMATEPTNTPEEEKEKEKEKEEDEAKRPEPKPTVPTVQQMESIYSTMTKWERKKLRKELLKKEAKRRWAAEPMSIEDAVYRRPLEFAMLHPDLSSRIDRLGPTPDVAKTVQGEWTRYRKMITPELKLWAEHERKRCAYINDSDEKKKGMSGARLYEYSQSDKAMRERLEQQSEKLREQAVKSLKNPDRPEAAVITREIREDTRLLRSVHSQIRSLKADVKDWLQYANPKERHYIEKRYGTRISRLERISAKIAKELRAKRTMVYQIEAEVPVAMAPRRWRLVARSKLASALPAQATRLRLGTLRMNGIIRRWMFMKVDPQLRTQADQIRRGAKTLEIMGHSSAPVLRRYAGNEERAIMAAARGRGAGKDDGAALEMALNVGGILIREETAMVSQRRNIPLRLKGTHAEEPAVRLMARCKALGIRLPKEFWHLSPEEFGATVQKSLPLSCMVSEGSSYLVLCVDGMSSGNMNMHYATEVEEFAKAYEKSREVANIPVVQEIEKQPGAPGIPQGLG